MLHIKVRGGAYERGHMHGQRFSALIREHVAQYQLDAEWNQEKLHAVDVIQKNISSQLPDQLDEMSGIADGAEIPLRDLVALNYWIEVLQTTVGYGCSLIAFTNTPDGVLLGKNSDHDLAAVRYMALQQVRADGREETLDYMRGTFVGTTSTRAGINSAGLAVCGAALIPNATNWEGVPVMALIGHILGHCSSIEEAIATARSLPAINYGANIMVGDCSGAVAVIERLPHHFAVRRPDSDVIFNTNHCLSDETVEGMQGDSELLVSSRQRFETLEKLVPQASHSPAGMQKMLSDHSLPGAICQHGSSGWYTCASFLVLPAARSMWVAAGCPCAVDMKEHHLE